MSGDMEQALKAIEETLAVYEKGTPAERKALHDLAETLRAVREKVAAERVTIAVFGEISTGKSSIVNALLGHEAAEVDVVGGTTRSVGSHAWQSVAIRNMEGATLEILDTPGINEVDGQTREAMAVQASKWADLVLFIIDGDLNHAEHEYLARLAALNRHVVLVLNKADLYSETQRQRLADVLTERVQGIGGSVDIVMTSANPRGREIVKVDAEGNEVVTTQKISPDVEALKKAILHILESEGRTLLALNATLFAAEASDRFISERLHFRRDEANALTWKFAGIKALAVGVNPIPILDAAGGFGVDVLMVMTLSDLYEIKMTRRRAHGLMARILGAMGLVVGVEWGTHFLSGALNALTLGAAKIITSTVQGAAAGWTSFIVGRAATEYFANGGSWGEGGPKSVVEKIIQENPRSEVIERLKRQIQESIRFNKAQKEKAEDTREEKSER